MPTPLAIKTKALKGLLAKRVNGNHPFTPSDFPSISEQWNLVQAITHEVDPLLQEDIDQLRRDIVSTLGMKKTTRALATVRVVKLKNNQLRWTDIQLTPELSFSLDVYSKSTTQPMLKQLRQLLSNQHFLIKEVLHHHEDE